MLSPEGLKPDVVAYTRNSGRTQRTDFGLFEVHVEVKMSGYDDPFDDNRQNAFEHDSNTSKDTMGQITSYAVAQLAMQFRTPIFSVLIFKTSARLIRWDRAGAIVTASFDYRITPHLIDFFRRYDLSSPAERGLDTSVSIPTESEASAAIKELGLKEGASLLKFAVPSGQDGSIAYYIGSKSSFNGNGAPTGATRTFVVYDVQNKNLAYLKDTWRIDLPGLEMEGAIYECLHKAGVSNIAPLVCGNDIPDQHTRTEEFVSEPWARTIRNDLRAHQHYRLVLGVIGRDLKKFESSWELVNAMADALQGESVTRMA